MVQAKCHPQREHYARGLCSVCYNREHSRKRIQRDTAGWNAYHTQYYREHRDELLAQRRKSYGALRKRLRSEMIQAYGGKCRCCGEVRKEFLTLEHKNNKTGRALRETTKTPTRRSGRLTGTEVYRQLKKAGWPKRGIELLCMNCNFAKGIWGYCPHEKEGNRGKNDQEAVLTSS